MLPVELEGRIAPTAFTFFMEALNIHLREAYSTKGAVVDNVVAVLTWWTSLLWRKSKFEAVSGERVATLRFGASSMMRQKTTEPPRTR